MTQFFLYKREIILTKVPGKCRECGSDQKPHKAKGYCQKCYQKFFYRKKYSKSSQVGDVAVNNSTNHYN